MRAVEGCDLALKLTALRQFDTIRLIPSRFADREDSVLSPLAETDADLHDLFDLDNATSKRRRGESGGLPGIGVEELVFGVPNFRMINAAFTYPRPEGSRFNGGQRGAWYCAFEAATSLAEIIFHKTVEYQEINRFDDSISYQAMLADFNSTFYDLRGVRDAAKYLKPDSYFESQALAQQLLEEGALGILYPSVRRKDGNCLACFRPALVGNVRKGQAYRLTWAGSPIPVVETE